MAEHFQCDPATLTENQLREYFLFLRQHKHCSRSPMKMAKYALLCFYVECLKVTGWTAMHLNPGPMSESCVQSACRLTRAAWALDWVADVQPVGTGEPALKYLAAYVFRTALSSTGDPNNGI